MDKKYYEAVSPDIFPSKQDEVFVVFKDGELDIWRYADRQGFPEDIDYWLKPVEVPATDAEKLAIGFAEWITDNLWIQFTGDSEWIHHDDEECKNPKSTPDLLTMYLNEKQKG